MRLALNLGYWDRGGPAAVVALAQEAERLGYDSVWAAEAYGSDSPSVLAWVGARTERIALGSAVMQIPGRTPAMTAMTAATIDALSGGRFRLGLGVSGPQVSEGWHGVRFGSPLRRTREYVEIVRMALRRDTLRYDGGFWTLPLPDGPGKALKLTIRPTQERVPVYLAAVGPRSLELAGEIADGWLAIFFSPEHAGPQLAALAAGRGRAGHGMTGSSPHGFDVVPTVPVVVGADLEVAADALRGYCALYLGGMGSREKNFYNELAVRMGFGQAAARVQEHFLAGRHREAAAAVPFEFIDQTALLGPPERIAERIGRYAAAGATTLAVSPYAADLAGRLDVLRTAAEALPPA